MARNKKARKMFKQSGSRHHKKPRNFRERKPHFADKVKANKNQGSDSSGDRQNLDVVNLKEDQVGITEYINPAAGFTGVIKARFSDFHVNEIDLDGNEVKLTDQEVPVPEIDSLSDSVFRQNKKELEDVLTGEIWKRIESLLEEKQSGERVSVDIDVTELNKDRRTLIHKVLKEHFGSALVSTTSTIDSKKFIQCFKSKGADDLQRNRWTWPGEYVYFVVHKENFDTVLAAANLAKGLKLRPSMVNYAGTKDKRGITSQLFCVKKREPKAVANTVKKIRHIKVGNFTFKENVLKLGELKGNRFRIAIRHVDGDEEEIEKSLNSMKNNGFINYYGLQRFGNSAIVPTYEVGIALLKSDYKLACELILKPREGDRVFLKEVREFWWKTRNSVEAAARIRGDKLIEKKLLDGLANFGENDYANALRRIPRNMLLLYTHSYQSLIWNRIASRRIKEFGLKLLPGDLVYKESSSVMDKPNVLDVVDAESLQETLVDADDESEQSTAESQFKTMVQAITEDDIANNHYTIFDIVLPLPGHDITYPSNEIANWYEEILAERDLTSEKLKHNVKTYSLGGAYRKLLVKPEKLSWEFKRYDSPESILIASDFESLTGREADKNIPEGKFKALLFDFILPSSAYATMALREILKSDTSVYSQQKLTEMLMKDVAADENKGSDGELDKDSATGENDDNVENDEAETAAVTKRKAILEVEESCSAKKVKSE